MYVGNKLLRFSLLDEDVVENLFVVQIGDDEGGNGRASVDKNLEVFVVSELAQWNSG